MMDTFNYSESKFLEENLEIEKKGCKGKHLKSEIKINKDLFEI